MTIELSDKTKVEPEVTLAGRIGMEGHVRWRDMTACKLTFEDNDPEYVEVFVICKRQLHVVTDQMLRAKRDMEENTVERGRINRLNLNLFPV